MLHDNGALSGQDFDRARAELASAQAERDRAAEQLELLRQGPREEQIAAQRAVLGQAKAGIAQAEANLTDGVVRAPFPGVVTVRHREPGETVPAGAPIVTVMNPADRWVRIYVREDEIGAVRLGQPATITTDAYPDRRFGGRVSFIARQAEFTPSNVQTKEERVKLVYEVKVQVTDDPRYALKVGTPADVRLDVEPR